MDLAEENSAAPGSAFSPEDLGQLKTEHTALEGQIAELGKLRFPTEEEETKIKRLKREKLTIKEKIERQHLQET